ncbi:MAG: flavodoxin family protein [Nitrospiraceae bacterium]|nr:flavodoxin family protein [Nitrospiraceae bacterium]
MNEQNRGAVLVLNGSPRKNGVTSSILRMIAEEAGSAGARVEWVDVNSLSVRPCIGCLKCRPDKKCILPRDDGHRVGELIETCSALVVGTPTYWGNMSGTLKILFDRNVPAFEHYVLNTLRFPAPKHNGKKAAIITASLAPFPFNQLSSQSRGAIRAVKTVLNAGGFDIAGTINVPLPKEGAVIGQRWAAKAKALGRSLAGSVAIERNGSLQNNDEPAGGITR